MSWIVGLVWGVAVLIAVVVLGICAFDLHGKSRRLSKDLAGLTGVREELQSLLDRLMAAQRRMPGR